MVPPHDKTEKQKGKKEKKKKLEKNNNKKSHVNASVPPLSQICFLWFKSCGDILSLEDRKTSLNVEELQV